MSKVINQSSSPLDMDTIGTETQKGGGLIGDLVCPKDNIALSALKDHELEAASYILRKTKAYIKGQDENGYTILHYIIKNYKAFDDPVKILTAVLRHDDIKCIINLQTTQTKETAIILAVKLALPDEIISMLLLAGADPKISDVDHNVIDIEQTETHNIESEKMIESKVSNFLRALSNARAIRDTSEMTLGIGTMIMTPHPKPQQEKKPESKPEAKPPTEQIAPFVATKPLPAVDEAIQTSEFVRQFVDKELKEKKEVPQVGGTKRSSMGQRKLNMYSEYNAKYEMSGGSDAESDGSQLSRLIDNQADEIHKRTVQTIMKLMGVDEETAGYYKSALYWRVKEMNPELKRIERALEMEKLATSEILKEIDPKEIKAKIEEFRKNKPPREPHSFEKKDKPKKEEKEPAKPKKPKKTKEEPEPAKKPRKKKVQARQTKNETITSSSSSSSSSSLESPTSLSSTSS